jgi:Tol biopolymer transport system component
VRTGTLIKLSSIFLAVSLSLLLVNEAPCASEPPEEEFLPKTPSPSSEINLKNIPYKIVYETFRETDGKENWELYIMNADGSNQINLTKTPDLDEMYPHASPDGTRLCFVVDEGTNRRNKTRSVYYMNIDGSNRVSVAKNARQPCWGPDGKNIAYLRAEYENYSTREYATSELMIYNLETGQHKEHPNKTLHHLYAICWSPDGNWFLGVVAGNTEYSDTILALEANGKGVYDLAEWAVIGCRPDIRFDGKKLTWGETDWDLCVGDIDFGESSPRVDNVHKVVKCLHSEKIYHVDFSPDGKYIAFSYGPSSGGQQVGGKAEGWNICLSDLSGKWIKITTDGNHNKEPDWVPLSSPVTVLGTSSEESQNQENLPTKK